MPLQNLKNCRVLTCTDMYICECECECEGVESVRFAAERRAAAGLEGEQSAAVRRPARRREAVLHRPRLERTRQQYDTPLLLLSTLYHLPSIFLVTVM